MRDSPLNNKRQIHKLTKEIYRPTKAIHQNTNEFYQVSKDGTLRMIIDSINISERYNECTVSPFGLLLAALRVMPSAPSGTTCPLANARGQTVVVEALWGLGRPSGTACNLPLVSR